MLCAMKPSTAKTENPANMQVNTLVKDTKTASVWQLLLYCKKAMLLLFFIIGKTMLLLLLFCAKARDYFHLCRIFYLPCCMRQMPLMNRKPNRMNRKSEKQHLPKLMAIGEFPSWELCRMLCLLRLLPMLLL